ncbi:MAG: amino acid racemase [Erythrobacter sp.]|nr:amino acid racemase [Erythrobacter sp.]
MHKLGLIGGMSWVSTRTYYERINRYVQRHVDKTASAPMLIESLDFAQLYRLDDNADWQRAAAIIGDSARRLEAAGAEMLIIGANSMHKVYREVEAMVGVPILHIAECVGAKMAEDRIERAALIGTRNVMTESFYRRRLVAYGIDLLPPEMGNVETLDRIIYDELMLGKVSRDSERTLRSMFVDFEKVGAQAVILANTELEQVVDTSANVIPIYDCTAIHADAAAAWMIAD